MPHVFSCPMDFNLLCDRGQQGGVLNPTKNDQSQVFLAVWVIFPKFFGQVKGWLSKEMHKMVKVSHVVACKLLFFCFMITFLLFYDGGWQGGVFKVIKIDYFLVFLAV